jgi:hypothetical protein
MISKTDLSALTGALDDTAAPIRELNEKVIAAAKQSGTQSLDAYEKTLASLLSFGERSLARPSWTGCRRWPRRTRRSSPKRRRRSPRRPGTHSNKNGPLTPAMARPCAPRTH